MVKNLLILLFSLFFVISFQSKDLVNYKNNERIYTVPTNIVFSNLTATSVTVSWDPISTANYAVMWRPVWPQGGANWTSASVVGNPIYTITGLWPCQQYEVRVADVSAVDMSSVYSFTTPSPSACTSMALNSNVMHISNVTYTPGSGSTASTMINNSVSSNYSDYRPDPTKIINLTYGSSGNTISVSKAGSSNLNTYYITAWLDYNGDEVFTANEMIFNSTGNNNAVVNNIFSVPSYSSGMWSNANCRVTLRIIYSNNFVVNGCGSFAEGEVEDYGVSLSLSSNLSTAEVNKSKEIMIYPNPVSTQIFVSGISTEEKYEVYSLVGQKLMKGKTKNSSIDVHNLQAGTYILELKNKSLKFIKK